MDKIDYQKINFRRRTVQYARSYTEENNAGGGITHTPKPGSVLDDGVLPTPENMAYIDGKIKELVDAANALIEEAEALERTVSAQGISIDNNARGISDIQRVDERQSSNIAELTRAHNALAEDEEALEVSFNAFAARRDNPNEVTKAQVGLGSVPNVSTNDQTPTFTEATSNQNLASGEKLSLSLGKIARGLKQLWAHIGKRDNPHEVTKVQVGLGNVPNVTTNNQTPTYQWSENLVNLVSGETVSTAFGKMATAISTLWLHITNLNNPHNTGMFDIIRGTLGLATEPDVVDTFTGNGASAASITVNGYSRKGQFINLGFAPRLVVILIYTGTDVRGHSQNMLSTSEAVYPTDHRTMLDVAMGQKMGIVCIGPSLNYYHSGCGTTYRTAKPEALLDRKHGGAVVYGNGFIVQSYNVADTDTVMRMNIKGQQYPYMAWR